MRSVPAAMTWEAIARDRWNHALSILAAVALPTLVLGALRHEGPIDAQDQSLLVMHIIMMFCYMLLFSAVVVGGQGSVARLFAYPLCTSEIVGWRLAITMAIVAVQMAVSITAVNLLCGTNWPIWGPTLTAAAAVTMLQSVAWLTEKSGLWLIFGVSVVGIVLGTWFWARYGTYFYDPQYYWRQMTPTDVVVLVLVAVGAYWLGVTAVARNRRGEPPLSLGIVDWLFGLFELSRADHRALDTPFGAECWSIWKWKAWIMPTAVAVLIPGGLLAWLIASRIPEDLFFGFLAGGTILCFIAFVAGIAIGNTGPNDADYVMGQFVATRPISDTDMARAILRTAFKSVCVAWSMWIVAFTLVCVALAATGNTRGMQILSDVRSWLGVPLTLLVPWMITANFTCLGLVGYAKRIVTITFVGLAAFIGCGIASKFLLTPSARGLVNATFWCAVATIVTIGVAWIYIEARRRQLIADSTMWAALAVWTTATGLVIGVAPESPGPLILGYLLIGAAVALFIAPFAAGPLAVSINRHR